MSQSCRTDAAFQQETALGAALTSMKRDLAAQPDLRHTVQVALR